MSAKNILGLIEWVEFPELGLEFEAKVDSGARRSSINAWDIEEEECEDGTYVHFSSRNLTQAEIETGEFDNSIETQRYSAKIIKKVTVRQAAAKKQRIVILLSAKVGDLILPPVEVNLNDRRHMAYSCLLGRQSMPNCLIDHSELHSHGGIKSAYREKLAKDEDL